MLQVSVKYRFLKSFLWRALTVNTKTNVIKKHQAFICNSKQLTAKCFFFHISIKAANLSKFMFVCATKALKYLFCMIFVILLVFYEFLIFSEIAGNCLLLVENFGFLEFYSLNCKWWFFGNAILINLKIVRKSGKLQYKVFRQMWSLLSFCYTLLDILLNETKSKAKEMTNWSKIVKRSEELQIIVTVNLDSPHFCVN